MGLFFVCIENDISRTNDMVIKVRAKTKEEARKIARYSFAGISGTSSWGVVYSKKEFLEYDLEWHGLLWGTKAINE